jgi:hypothetical protein
MTFYAPIKPRHLLVQMTGKITRPHVGRVGSCAAGDLAVFARERSGRYHAQYTAGNNEIRPQQRWCVVRCEQDTDADSNE